MIDTFLNTHELHLGITTRCNLECPLCARTTEKNRWFGSGNIDINFETYKKFLDDLKINEILFCGNWGDPIFYPDFFQLLTYIKSRNIKIRIHTNGTGHNNKWWEKLSNILSLEDELYFSIDGIESNFTIYRKNASWHKIIKHISTIVNTSSRPLLFWKYIIFKYNENTIVEAHDIAKNLKMDYFMLQCPWIPDDQPEWMPSFSPLEFVTNNKLKKIHRIDDDAIYLKFN